MYETVIIGIMLQFFSEKSEQYLLCSRPRESPMTCQKIIVGGTINLLFNSLSVLGFMQCGKLICLYSYFLYIPLPILCHYLYFYRFISLQCFLVVQTLCLYIYLKADFKRVQSLSLLKDSASCSYFISPGTFVSALVLLTRLSSANPFGLFATRVCCSQTSESWF